MVLFAESIDDDCTTRALEENGNVHAESIDVDCKARALDENENIYMYEESIKVDNEVEDEDGKTVIESIMSGLHEGTMLEAGTNQKYQKKPAVNKS